MASRLETIVQSEGLHWGNKVAQSYHGVASNHMDAQWSGIVWPRLSRYPIDFSKSMDFAGGFGRNARKLLSVGAQKVTLPDINPDCIAAVSAAFPSDQVEPVLVSGVDLSPVPSESQTFVYTFDAMVHFDPEVVLAYLPEFSRVLTNGGYAFVHHSNYSENPGADFRSNPHWRNYMTMALFKHGAVRAGFEVVEQIPTAWELPDLDCISILHKS